MLEAIAAAGKKGQVCFSTRREYRSAEWRGSGGNIVKMFLMIAGGIVLVILIGVAALVIVPLIMVADNASEYVSEPIDAEDTAQAKPYVLDFCNKVMRQVVPDPTKSDQVGYACACVWARAEPLMSGRTAAEVTNMLIQPSGGAPDAITQCAQQVGLIQTQ
jgi:hypothetical protein